MTEYEEEYKKQKDAFLSVCKNLLDNPDKYVQGFIRISTSDGNGNQEIFGFISTAELVGLLEIVKAGTIEANKDEEQN